MVETTTGTAAGLRTGRRQPPVLLVPFAVLMAAALAMKLALYGGASQDEAEWLLKTQSLQLGYDLENPPLVMWLGWAWQAIFGVGLSQLLAFKFLLLLGFYVLLFAGARAAFGGPTAAFATAAAPMGLYYVGWMTLNSYTHSIVLLLSLAGTFCALAAVLRRPGLAAYAGLGVAMAAGLLAKYNYALFLGTLLLAMAWQPEARRRLLDPRMLLAQGLAAALAGPHGVWALQHAEGIAAAAGGNLVAQAGSMGAHLDGLVSLAKALVNFALPLALLLALWFWRELRAAAAHPGTSRPGPAVAGVLWRQLTLMLALMVIGVILGDVTRVRIHYLYPLALFAVPVLAAAVAGGASRRKLLSFGAACLALNVVAVAALAGHAHYEARDCSRCGQHTEFRAYAEALRGVGFDGGTIVSFSTDKLNIGENLRPFFEDSRILSTKWPMTRPPQAEGIRDCLVVWPTAHFPAMATRLRQDPPPVVGAALPEDARVGRVQGPLRYGDRAGPEVGYALILASPAHCA